MKTQEHIDENVSLTTSGDLYLPEYCGDATYGSKLHDALVERLGDASPMGAEGSGWRLEDSDVSDWAIEALRGDRELVQFALNHLPGGQS